MRKVTDMKSRKKLDYFILKRKKKNSCKTNSIEEKLYSVVCLLIPCSYSYLLYSMCGGEMKEEKKDSQALKHARREKRKKNRRRTLRRRVFSPSLFLPVCTFPAVVNRDGRRIGTNK